MKVEREIYLAGGCFWGLENYLQQIYGVLRTEVGYANGNKEDPTYEEVCTNQFGFAEAVHVIYDATILSLEQLVYFFYRAIDPTSDIGSQYRTGIYYTTKEELAILQKSIETLQKEYLKEIVIEIEELKNFYLAEEYHQRYLEKHPSGYCHISKQLQKEVKIESEKIGKAKEKLSTLQYHVTQENGTEPPFQNSYWDNKEEGIYVDIISGEPLFLSTDKFDAGCGWPSFSKTIKKEAILEKEDYSHGMVRTEVRSKKANSHLGHVFSDGPKQKGGLRYCINSAALRFIPLSKMEEEGYGEWIKELQS